MSRTAKTYEEKIASTDEKIQQLINQKKQIIQQQKATERKERNSRLCRRHGLLEKYMPALISITDEQFEAFIRQGINTSYGRDILAKIAASGAAIAPSTQAEPANAVVLDGGTKPPKADQTGA